MRLPQQDPPVLIGLGANLSAPGYDTPRATLTAALARLAELGVVTVERSRWYQTAPVPASDQPWYTNAVARLSTQHDPATLLALLLRVEAEFGRVRGARDAARVIDLDIVDYAGLANWNTPPAPGEPLLPHPRAHERAFVLRPLAELVPNWRHPVLQRGVDALIAALPPEQVAEPQDASACVAAPPTAR